MEQAHKFTIGLYPVVGWLVRIFAYSQKISTCLQYTQKGEHFPFSRPNSIEIASSHKPWRFISSPMLRLGLWTVEQTKLLSEAEKQQLILGLSYSG